MRQDKIVPGAEQNCAVLVTELQLNGLKDLINDNFSIFVVFFFYSIFIIFCCSNYIHVNKLGMISYD